jgi:hypothetical protein
MGAERLCRDLHPVEVTLGGQVIKAARVFITTNRVVAYREGGGPTGRKVPVVALSVDLAEEAPQPSRTGLTASMALETSEGTVYLNRGAGCGCHSVLKVLGPLVAW